VELFTFNLAIVEALKTVQKDPFEPLFEKGVHRGSILNLAMSPMRAVIASVCEDKTCKFWDYSNDFKELFSHQFHETPNCVALHPLSFLCVIGFKEGMRLYYVLDDDLKLLYTENMKNCNAVAFSEGG
jgi:WD40 repeat protein